MRKSGSRIVVETLISHGVKDVFGFPGGQILNVYDALFENARRLNHYITCHEQGAAHAADGYARATGKTGVVIATSGPGATNLVTGIAAAYLDSSPIVAITGNVPLNLIGKDSFQEVDIAGITMPVTKHNYIVKDIRELEDTIREAFQIAASGRPGPVLVDIPQNVQSESCEFNGGMPLSLIPNPVINEANLAVAAEMINKAERPFIYAGGGVVISNASEELARFAEKIDAPVGFSLMGLTAVDSENPRAMGMTGMHGTFAAAKMKSEADLIIGIGTRFSDRATGDKVKYQRNAKIIHIDIDNAEIDKNIKTHASILGNIKEALPRLTELVRERKNESWRARAVEYKKNGKDLQNETGYIPRKIIRTVRKYTKDDTIIVTDVGQHQMWTAQYYNFREPRTFLTSGGLGAMGFGVGAAIGASIAKNKARVVLFTGDGSFHMNFNEIATAVALDLPIVIIIMNNGVLGMVRQWQEVFFESRYSCSTLERKTDYKKLAESLGAVGFNARDTDELETALASAFSSVKPVVINCVINRDEKVLPMIPPNKGVTDMITG